MGVRGWLARQAVRRAHVLLVESPGSWLTRVAAEQAITARGWQAADSPADADVLMVCGSPGDQLTEAVARVWEQMPGPRARVDAPTPDVADAALAQASALLLDDGHQRLDARQRPARPHPLPEDDEEQPGDHQGMDHGDMDHGDMDMSGPGGIPLASGAADRDGLEMDVLHLPLGPVLRFWPAGIRLRCSLQGDVVTDAELDRLDESPGPRDLGSTAHHAAYQCDTAADVLSLAGWDVAAEQARVIRNRLLAADHPAGTGEHRLPTDAGAVKMAESVARLHARVARSRLLRWSLRDVGRIDAGVDDPGQQVGGTPGDDRVDVYGRLLRRLAMTVDLLRGAAVTATADDHQQPITAAPGLVRGLDVAAVRLVVASLAPLPVHRATPARGGGGRG